MASYQTTVTLATAPAGNVLLSNGSTVVTYSVDVGAQAAVAALMSGYVPLPVTPAAGHLARASDGTLTWAADAASMDAGEVA